VHFLKSHVSPGIVRFPRKDRTQLTTQFLLVCNLLSLAQLRCEFGKAKQQIQIICTSSKICFTTMYNATLTIRWSCRLFMHQYPAVSYHPKLETFREQFRAPCLLLPTLYNSYRFSLLQYFLRSLGSSVGIAIRYGLDGLGIESRCGRDFPHPSRTALRPTQRPIQWVPGLSRG
jgi:hypothetical protein